MKHLFVLLFFFLLMNCTQPAKTEQPEMAAATTKDTIACQPASSKLDTALITQLTGMKGVEKNGEFKITVPQNDLHVTVDGFKIIPFMGLGTWAAFSPCNDSAMVMGDIILTDKDLKPVQAEAIRNGFSITAIHNHFVRNNPNIMYMHIDRWGPVADLAKGVKAIFDKVKESRGKDPKSEKPDSVVSTINTARLDSMIGHKGESAKGVYKYTIGRPDVALKEHGRPVSAFMGFNTWSAWQGTPERAAVCGDFTMLEHEVQPVIKALVENGIEVVAVHNHMVHESPKIFFLHYWGVGKVDDLAKGFRAALDQTGKH